MSPWLLVSGFLLLGAAMAHSLIGEKVILKRLFRRTEDRDEPARRATDDPTLRATLRLAWHSLSVALAGFAVLLTTAAFLPASDAVGSALVGPVAVTMLALALLSLGIARGRHVGWMWYAAAAVAALSAGR
ncbi:MAG: hypothetical protein KF709_11690 [Gemmatimonadaceae bacterium]|nr:hypothetical protein [Gemmatimonadaceae bacterium]